MVCNVEFCVKLNVCVALKLSRDLIY